MYLKAYLIFNNIGDLDGLVVIEGEAIVEDTVQAHNIEVHITPRQ